MMNKTEEKKFQQLRKLGQELHVPIPEHFVELEVRDKDGKVIQTLKQRSHSWSRNAYNLLLAQMASKNLNDAGVFGAGLLSIKETGGVIRDAANGADVSSANDFESAPAGYRAAAGVITSGILVGSNNGAWTFEQFFLLTQITEGTGAGQLNHVATNVPTKSYNAGTLTWTITWIRYFNNNTAPPGDVLVNEVALVCYGKAGGLALSQFLMSRDVLGATVTIPATGQLKVTYTIQLTYPF